VLFFRLVQRFGHYVALAGLSLAAVLGACQETEPRFGDPNGIWGKKLPNEKASASSSSSGSAEPVTPPTVTMEEKHKTEKGTASSAPAPGAAKDCMACHTGTPGPKFAIGGRVETGGEGVANVTVRAGSAAAVTDKDGYFWATGNDIQENDQATALKEGGDIRTMSAVLKPADGDGSCSRSTCHGNGFAAIAP
jgi:hypothetical protein